MATKRYSLKTFYRSVADGPPEKPDRFFDPDATLVEERTLLIKAQSRSEAIRKAEREAKDYAHKIKYKNPYNQSITTQYLGIYDVCEIVEPLADKTEIFSVSRLMSKRVNDKKIARAFVEKRQKDLMHTKRKKFVNREYAMGLQKG